MGNIFFKLVLFNEEKTLSNLSVDEKRLSESLFYHRQKDCYGSFYLILWPR